MVRLQTQERTALMLHCGKGLNVKTEPIVTSLYGLKVTQNKKTKNYYEQQRQKALETLGNRYRLFSQVERIR